MDTPATPLLREVPADDRQTITSDLPTLAAAFRLAYLAGRGDAHAEIETLTFLKRTITNMRRSMRRARPTPQAGVEAGLDLMLAAVEERLAASQQAV